MLTIWLVASLACHIGAHLALVGGLFGRQPRARWLVALVLPPLAPYWGWEAGMRRRALAWVGTVVAYVLGVALASV